MRRIEVRFVYSLLSFLSRVTLILASELVLSSVCKAPSEVREPWEDKDILKVLHDMRKEIKASAKVFMKTLRHASLDWIQGTSPSSLLHPAKVTAFANGVGMCVGRTGDSRYY
jgi:hypothetical protein